jgi:hypothetical protein
MINFKYDRLVPRHLQKAAGVATYVWQVNEPWQRPYNYVRHPKGGALQIPPSAYCQLLDGAEYIHLLVPVQSHPELAESLLLFGQALFTTNRVERYLKLHKSFESLGPHGFHDFTAVRHGLAHASTALSRPKTVAALKKHFGSAKIDLDDRRHVRQLYIQCGDLLRVLDQVQATRLREALPHLRLIRSHEDVLMDWRIDGIPGIYKPIRVRID